MQALLATTVMLLAPAPADAMTIDARVEGGPDEYAIVLDVEFKDGYAGSAAGLSAPIVQIDVPPSVRLTGEALESYRDLARNEFLNQPYERLIDESPARIGFSLANPPADDERFGINVVAYLGKGDNAWFVRRRIEIAPRPDATARPAPAIESDWGVGDGLQIGDHADDFTLPTADGRTIALSDYHGKKNVVVTTYRAFW